MKFFKKLDFTAIRIHTNRYSNVYSFFLILIGFPWLLYLTINFLSNLPATFPSDNSSINIDSYIFKFIISSTILIMGVAIKWLDNNNHKNDFYKIVLVSSIVGGFIIYLVILKIHPLPLISKAVPNDWWSAVAVVAAIVFAVVTIEVVKIKEVSNFKSDVEAQMNDFAEYIKVRKIVYEEFADEYRTPQEKWKQVYDLVTTLKNPNYVNNFSFSAWSYSAWKENVPVIAKKMRKAAYIIDHNDPWNGISYANILIDESYKKNGKLMIHDENEFSSYEIENILKLVKAKGPYPDTEIHSWIDISFGKLYWKKHDYKSAANSFKKACDKDVSSQYWNYAYNLMAILTCPNKVIGDGKIDSKNGADIVQIFNVISTVNEVFKDKEKIIENVPQNDRGFLPFIRFVDAWIAILTTAVKKYCEVENGSDNKDLEEVKRQVSTLEDPYLDEKLKTFNRSFSPLNSLEFSSIPVVDRYSFHNIFERLDSVYKEDIITKDYWENLSILYLTFYHFYGAYDTKAHENLLNGYAEKIERSILNVWLTTKTSDSNIDIIKKNTRRIEEQAEIIVKITSIITQIAESSKFNDVMDKNLLDSLIMDVGKHTKNFELPISFDNLGRNKTIK